jgi:hypothetical protein
LDLGARVRWRGDSVRPFVSVGDVGIGDVGIGDVGIGDVGMGKIGIGDVEPGSGVAHHAGSLQVAPRNANDPCDATTLPGLADPAARVTSRLEEH